MEFDIFVIPFSIGFCFVVAYVITKFVIWIKDLPTEDRKKLGQMLFSTSFFSAMNEIFMECLLHRKIFKSNPLLGYMHMSLAFGWFMLICLGNFETKIFSDNTMNFPYYPIFFRFFEPNPAPFFFSKGFYFIMDFFLLLVLTGVALALIKRLSPKAFGMKKTTVHIPADKMAIITLWFVFPLRFLAESFTSGIYHNGGFLTGTAGAFFASFLRVDLLAYPAWWAYSIVLGLFFIAVPYSRYMHILSEIMLIFMRKAGIKESKTFNSFSEVELNSCSRCGLCIDTCQLASVGVNHVQSSYFIRDTRYKKLEAETVENCLMCGRCNNACPVGIDNLGLRYTQRNKFAASFTTDYKKINTPATHKADVLYFAGCMSHLTPSIKKSMVKILDASGKNYSFMDKDGSICCGRPLLLSGQYEAAKSLMDKNIEQIKASGAKTLVTSCPICYKMFKDEYKLNIEVFHHSQYILHLIEEGKIALLKQQKQVVYHDPCELGRGSNIYIEPRVVINYAADLSATKHEYENALCCGGSLGNTRLDNDKRGLIASQIIDKLGVEHVDALITACPLCKKSFDNKTNKPVIDIAQLVAESLIPVANPEPKITARNPLLNTEFAKQ